MILCLVFRINDINIATSETAIEPMYNNCTPVLMCSELLKKTCRVANVLKNQCGVKKGDTVVIYMPTMPLAVASMLACARIGAVHR